MVEKTKRAYKMKYPFLMLIVFLLFWVVMAINPLERDTWFIENILTFLWLPVIVISYFKFRLSTFSYLLIFIFFLCHTVGTHYTYTKVPLGYVLGSWMGSDRNQYDRLIHFVFGLLLYYPVAECVKKHLHVKGLVEYLLPALIVIFISDMYEIVEWITAVIVAPEQGIAYLGIQGDQWDAQKDMILGVIGVILALVAHVLWQRAHKNRR